MEGHTQGRDQKGRAFPESERRAKWRQRGAAGLALTCLGGWEPYPGLSHGGGPISAAGRSIWALPVTSCATLKEWPWSRLQASVSKAGPGWCLRAVDAFPRALSLGHLSITP